MSTHIKIINIVGNTAIVPKDRLVVRIINFKNGPQYVCIVDEGERITYDVNEKEFERLQKELLNE